MVCACSVLCGCRWFFLKLINHFRHKRNYSLATKKKGFYCTYTHRNTHCTVTLHVHVWQVADLSVSHTIHDTMDSSPLAHGHATCLMRTAECKARSGVMRTSAGASPHAPTRRCLATLLVGLSVGHSGRRGPLGQGCARRAPRCRGPGGPWPPTRAA